MNEEQIARLNETDEFDEDWEKVVFRACLNDHYLNNKAFNISNLLNTIKTLVPQQSNFEEEIERVLTLSSVTSVNVEKQNKPPKFTKIRMSGWSPFETSLKQKGFDSNIVEIVKSIHDYAEEEFKEHIIFQFTPNFLTLQSKNSKVKQKTFCWVKFQKRQVRLEGLNKFTDTLPIIQSKEGFNDEIKNLLGKAIGALNNGE